MYATPVTIPSPVHQAKAPILQRRCACGGEVGPDRECAACRAKRMQAGGKRPCAAYRSRCAALAGIIRSDLQCPRRDGAAIRIRLPQRANPFRRAGSCVRFGSECAGIYGRAECRVRSGSVRSADSRGEATAGPRIGACHTATGSDSRHHCVSSRRMRRMKPKRIECRKLRSRVEAECNCGMQSAPAVARTFSAGASNCVAGRNSAPADVDTELPAMDIRAGEIAAEVATALKLIPVDASVRAALEGRFGLPPVFANGRSMNRLTGAGVADQETAITGEIRILARRFRLSARTFSQTVFYRCVGPDGGSTIGGCAVTNADCVGGSAISCRGSSAIFICPGFWTRFPTTDERALVLMHETFHINFGRANPSIQGESAKQTQGGSGGRYNNASCYESFASDITGVTVSDTCPAVAP